MIFKEESNGYIIVLCEKCGQIHKKPKIYCKQYGDEYHINPPVTCTCGNTERIAYKNEIVIPTSQEEVSSKVDIIKCPNCGSTQITAGNRGFGLKNAVVGGVLLGTIGLLGGLIGSKKVMVTCLKCGKQWEAGKG